MYNRSCTTSAVSKAVSLPMLVLSRSQHGHDQERQPQRHCNMLVGSRNSNKHTMAPLHNAPFGGNGNQTIASILQDDFQPLPLNRIPQNRRMSLLEEGDEVFFAGKKFFFVEKPSSLPTLPTRLEGGWDLEPLTCNNAGVKRAV
jgi:hypothetical protein